MKIKKQSWPQLSRILRHNQKAKPKYLGGERGETQTKDKEDSYAAKGSLEFALWPNLVLTLEFPCPAGSRFAGLATQQ